MASLTDLSSIALSVDFSRRINMAAFNCALAVMAESANTPSHAQRVIFAATILAGNSPNLLLAYGILNNTTIAAEADVSSPPGFAIPDGDLQFAMNSIFNAYAGVSN
jgi:hypothetical protein